MAITSKYIIFTYTLLSSFGGLAQTYKVEEVLYTFGFIEVPKLNSTYDDFSPQMIGDQIIFTSGRESNLVLLGENNWGKTGFYNVFSATIKKSDSIVINHSVPQPFSAKIANNNHTGPVSFTPSGDTIFYTQLSERKKRIKEERHPQLYMAIKKDGEWVDHQLLPFCNEKYSYGHPAWDDKHEQLYFSSTQPGGKGGKDIYSAVYKTGNWMPLIDSEVNTEYDEMFPFKVGADLFFASNRPGGKGELDVYWKLVGSTEPIKNMKDLNTPGDDFGLFINANQNQGFLSRKIAGNDDLIMLTIERKVSVTNELAGKFLFRNIGTAASNLEILLLNEEDPMFELFTDENGEFRFRDLPLANYTIQTISEANLELVLFNEKGEATTYLLQDAYGKFQYKKIDLSQAGTTFLLSKMNAGSEKSFTTISGQFVYELLPGEYADSLKVMLVDAEGNIVFTEYSDARGNFNFKNVPLNHNYIITTENVEEDMFAFIFNGDGEVLTQLKQNEKAQLVYKKIKNDYADNLQVLADEEDVFELETMVVTGNFNYRKLEGQFSNGLMVYLFNEEGILLDSTVTSEGGKFMFRGLSPDLNYQFKMREDNSELEMEEFTLFVEDRYGNVVADLYRGGEGFFINKKFEIETNYTLAKIELKDELFQFQSNKNSVSFSVYFDINSSYASLSSNQGLISLTEELKLNTNTAVKIAAYSDCRSSNHYNLWLSERRGNRLKEYFLNHGISSDRISVLAFGESQLVNDCKEDDLCPEEEHAKNRRVEIIVQK
jgi:outer membrane protein OmpA-like peptidoglycan-associated protein